MPSFITNAVFGACPQCARPRKSSQMVLLTGPSFDGVADKTARAIGAKRMRSNSKFLPGSRIPADMLYPEMHSRVKALCFAAQKVPASACLEGEQGPQPHAGVGPGLVPTCSELQWAMLFGPQRSFQEVGNFFFVFFLAVRTGPRDCPGSR